MSDDFLDTVYYAVERATKIGLPEDAQIAFAPNYHRAILVSPKNFDFVKSRYPTRRVEVCIYCDDKFFVVMRKFSKGTIQVRVSDLSIWVPGEYPFFNLKFKGRK